MRTLIVSLFAFCCLGLSAQEVIQWRGTDRTGIYKETGLLNAWPEGGPALIWNYDKLGEGHSSAAIANEKIYITGLTEGNGYLYVFDLNGKLLNRKEYGKEWDTSHNGSRGTVTVNDGKLYLYSGMGSLVCLDEKSLDVVWQKNVLDEFGGSNLRWGVNESPLIVGDKVFITPGGEKHNVVALDKKTGSLAWSCAGEGDLSAYCSPLYVADQQVPQIVTITGKHVLGIDVETGKKLWSFPYYNMRNIHPNTPVYADNMLLCVFGYGKGSVMLRLTDGGRKVEEVWENREFDSKTGGAVKVGNYVYGSGDNNKYWFCLEWKTGKQMYKERQIAVGNVISAGNMLYCYSDKGEMALVKATPQKFDIVSQFPVTLGTGPHWAHPVIYKGILYMRHGNALMAYKIN